MGATLTEWDGQLIVPPLIRTPRGWIEQAPSRCENCGGDSILIGWTACACRTDTLAPSDEEDRKSTRLNSSHVAISYAVFCLKKKKKNKPRQYHKPTI